MPTVVFGKVRVTGIKDPDARLACLQRFLP